MNVAMLCCHVRRKMRVGDVVLQNAEDNDTLVETPCVVLKADGVHTAILLLNAHRAGSERRLSQADAA